MKSHREEDTRLTLNYARPSRVPNEIGAWIGLVITLAVCLLAAILYYGRYG